ncbi:Hypothetical protein R9X50_00444200 [Acrodontium crateriforme]|uniref:Uncharacterized protein n=1 Tax=Acrodontium crateriforme TaxID=150365 RepID=A0AAQ3M4P9_9PEZI|nr:Hypothetical protein R9X50_00444200 [Acrodontium crateriforme]
MASEDSSSTTVLGKRRHIHDSTNDADRFVKRLNLLTLRDPSAHGSSTYIVPVQPPTANAPDRPNDRSHASLDDHMHVDDTHDRVYIHSIDDELADIEASEPDERLIFLPDIEKHFTQIPPHVLNPQGNKGYENQAMVLYSVPKSITVDEGHDSVRKAIIESRQRARDKAIEEARMEDMSRRYEDAQQQDQGPVETAHGYNGDYIHEDEHDPDEMDVS